MTKIILRQPVPDNELELSYARSSGPGGQNVNKVNSKALLRWNLPSSTVSLELKLHLARRLAHQLTKEGDILVSSDKYRDQGRNREDCLEKFHNLIASALVVQKIRNKTKPSHSRVRKNKESKELHSRKKRSRNKKEGGFYSED
jgi:ribosome-associated protein